MPKRDRSVADQAHALLKQRILTLDLAPGVRVDDVSAAEELSFSRTPVREALFRLASEGLVTVGQRGGFTVRSLDLLDVTQLFEAQVVVVRAIARLCAVHASTEDIGYLREASDRVDAAVAAGDPAAIAAHNAALHRLEAVVANNEHLRRAAFNIHDQGQRLAFLCFGGLRPDHATGLDAHYARTCADHTEAIDAYEHGDPDRAEAIAAGHVHLFRNRVVHFLTEDRTAQVHLADDLPGGQPHIELHVRLDPAGLDENAST